MTLRLSQPHGANLKSNPAMKIATAGERKMISSESLLFHVNPVLKTRHEANASKPNAATKRIPELHLNPVSQIRQAHNAIVTKATAAKSSNFHQVPAR